MGRFTPSCAVTGIGSLPFTDVHAAVEFVRLHSPEIPFWPQLPARGLAEHMLIQPFGAFSELLELHAEDHKLIVKNGKLERFIEELDGTSPELTRESAPGFWRLGQELTCCEDRDKIIAVKGQLIGPVSALCAMYSGLEPLWFYPRACEAVARFLSRQAAWQAEQLKKHADNVLLFFDEPMLTVAFGGKELASSAVLRESFCESVGAVKASGAICGVHSCGPFQSEAVLRSGVQLLSFNATAEFGQLEKVLAAEGLSEFLKGGGGLALGLLPTDDTLDAFVPDQKAEELDASIVAAGLDTGLFLSQTLITSTCGLALLTPERAERSFELAHKLAEEIL